MTDQLNIGAASWRKIEVGRVLLLPGNKLGAIIEIIDHKRGLVDSPDEEFTRQSVSFTNAFLTDFVVPISRGVRKGKLTREWKKAEIDEKWEKCNWAKKQQQQERRRNLTDFDRFKLLRLKKQRRFEEHKALAKIKTSA